MPKVGQVYISSNLDMLFGQALEHCHVIMFGAPAGCGKTTVAGELLKRRGLSFSTVDAAATDFAGSLEEALGAFASSNDVAIGSFSPDEARSFFGFPIIVVDNVEAIEDEAIGRVLFDAVATNPFVQFILLGHCAPPFWFDRYESAQIGYVFEPSDLLFDDEMLCALLADKKLSLSEDERRLVIESTFGYAPLVFAVAENLESDACGSLHAIDVALRDYGKTVDELLARRYTQTEIEYLLSLSFLDSFDMQLAEVVTGDPYVRAFLSRLVRFTRMFSSTKMGKMSFWQPVRQYLYLTMTKLWDDDRKLSLYRRAAGYLAAQGAYVEAVRCYDRCGDRQNIIKLLTQHARLNAREGRFRELWPYLRSLSEDEIRSSADLMSAMSMTAMLRCEFDESDRWFDELRTYAQQSGLDPHEARAAKRQIGYLSVALPQHSFEVLAGNLLSLSDLSSFGGELYTFSVTSGLPSLLNGARDFSGWTLDAHSDVLFSFLNRLAPLLLGRGGLGLSKCALLEIRYQRGGDFDRLALEVASSIAEVHLNGSPDTEFAMVNLLALIEAEQGNIADARSIMRGLKKRFEDEGKDSYGGNIDAVECRLALLEGDYSFWRRWVDRCKLDYRHPWTMDRFQLITLASCFLAMGRTRDCIDVLDGLRPFFERCERTLDLISLHVLTAVACWELEAHEGKGSAPYDWHSELTLSLDSSATYGFVRPIAEIGAPVVPLLEGVNWKGDSEFFERVVRMARKQAFLFPSFLGGIAVDRSAIVPRLTRSEHKVLDLLAKDYSNAQIMDELGIKLPTVKTHVLHIMKKLDARSRGQAKTIARELGLV